MEKYLSQFEVINLTLFWSPLPRYDTHDLAVRIEAELDKVKSEYQATELYYVHSQYSLSGLKGFFKDYHGSKNYLRDNE